MAFTENYLSAQVRQQGYLDIIAFVPNNKYFSIRNITSNDICSYSNITNLADISTFNTDVVATLEEDLWSLNGKIININENDVINNYVSQSVSDENGNFSNNPKLSFDAWSKYTIYDMDKVPNEYTLSILLNPSIPSSYPKKIILRTYVQNTLYATYTQDLEWDETTTEINEETGEPIIVHKILDTLPVVLFKNIDMQVDKLDDDNTVSKIEIEFVQTNTPHRRIRVSNIMFGEIMNIDTNDIISADYLDRASYVTDTLPSRTFKFELNNYKHLYDIDNPENSIITLDDNTIIMFRSGYNVYGYETDENGNLVYDEFGYPIINNPNQLENIEWDNWKQLRLLNVSATSGNSALFECGSVLDINIMDTEYYADDYRYSYYASQHYDTSGILIYAILDAILESVNISTSEIIEWSSDGVPVPEYSGGKLLPYEQWDDTKYEYYREMVITPIAKIKQCIQMIAFAIGATLIIKDNGKIKFACFDINKPSTFINSYNWTYKDFEEIPEPEQLNTIDTIDDITLLKYRTTANYDADGNFTAVKLASNIVINGNGSYNVRFSKDGMVSDWGRNLPQSYPYNKAGTITLPWTCSRAAIVNVSGMASDAPSYTLSIYGNELFTNVTNENESANAKLVFDTKIMSNDISSYNEDGTIKEKEFIRHKYFEWYNKKFKYKIKTRGEPLVSAGSYCNIQTEFATNVPGYILQNHWTFDGTWSGDMEVIALDN